MYTLLLRLGGPLQSWGSNSLYDNRGTDYYPTKSGIIGLVSAALGLKRGKCLNELNSMQFGVRIDCQGSYIKDFQITEMGSKLNKNLSSRAYLSDAIFLVGLASENYDLLSRIKYAVHNPKYAIFLGRKACPPTLPVDMGIVNQGLYDALFSYEWLVPDWRRESLFGWKDKLVLRIIIESEDGTLKKDVPISFESNNRRYGYRNVKETSGKNVCKDMLNDETKHDPMKELN